MKTIIKTLFIFAFLFSAKSYTQDKKDPTNYLTLKQYQEIKINGINWNNISQTNGNIDKMKKLFGSDLKIKRETEPSNAIIFWSDKRGFWFRFTGEDKYYLEAIYIDDRNSNMTIKGITITIGDPISKLGKLNIVTDEDGTKTVFIGPNRVSDSFIIIYLDANNKIKEIEYSDYLG